MTDLLLTGTVTAYTNGVGSSPGNPANTNDGNAATYSGMSTGAVGGASYPVRGWEADLGSSQWVEAFTLKEQAVNGSTIRAALGGTQAVGSYGSRLQYWTGAAWADIAGSWTADNLQSPGTRTYTFTSQLYARKFRIEMGGKQANGYFGGINLYTWSTPEGVAPPGLGCGFSANPLTGPPGTVHTFTDETTGSPDGWLWDFGDGNTSTLQNPTHVYTTAGSYTVTLTATRSSDADECTLVLPDYIVSAAVEWDIYAADDLNGPLLATIDNATARTIRIELGGPGFGEVVINRHATEATAVNFAKGNLVRVRFPEISTEYIFAFFLEQGDFELLSTSEEGGELLRFGGRGALAYLDRARMWNEAYSTGLDVSDTWTEVWQKSLTNPVGAALDPADPAYLYVISRDRKVRRLRQSDRAVVRTSPELWTGTTKYAAGLSADPSDATILWALEAPWLSGSTSYTKIRKVRISDWAVLATYDLGSAVKLTDIKVSASHIWVTRYDGTSCIQKRSKADGSLTTAYSITYGGVVQTLANGVSVNGTRLAYWFSGTKRALLSTEAAPTTITATISTTGISAFGGDWTTESAQDYFYPVSVDADVVWKYQLTIATPHDPVSGVWRLDEGTPGAILARLMAEWQHASRPQQPIPAATYDFDFTDDSTSDPWDAVDGTLEFSAGIGDLGMDTVLRLLAYGLVIQMSPYLALHAYNAGNFGVNRASATFAAGKVRLEAGVNVVERLTRRLDDRRVDTHMLAQGEGTLFATSTQDDLGYVREGFISTQLTDVSALEGTATAELAQERVVADALALIVAWGDDEAGGLYRPGPVGSDGHYWVGDTVRLHTGTGEFDYTEQNFGIYAISITEQPSGDWRAIAELSTSYIPGSTSGGSGSSGGSGGITGGASGGGTTSGGGMLTVRDTVSGTELVASTVESDWGVTQPAAGVVRVAPRAPALVDLTDAQLENLVGGQAPVWDDVLERWVPGFVGNPRQITLGSPWTNEPGEDGEPGQVGPPGAPGPAGASGSGGGGGAAMPLTEPHAEDDLESYVVQAMPAWVETLPTGLLDNTMFFGPNGAGGVEARLTPNPSALETSALLYAIHQLR